MKIETGQYTLQGKRDENQDACAVTRTHWGVVAVVCDGLGGHEGGREAAQLAVKAVQIAAGASDGGETAQQLVHRAVTAAHEAVCAVQRGRLAEMMTTIVVWAWQMKESTVCAVGHLGDSRAYRSRLGAPDDDEVGGFRRLTEDHAAGRHSVTRTVGERDGDGKPEVRTFACLPGDTFLLCTDGLHGTLSDEALAKYLKSVNTRSVDASYAAKAACHRALLDGSRDNITAVVIRTSA